ncbi:hypothetical protein [Hydrogenophaga electricum]|uniref:Uncharacterized protein n=1 Tax=Hydrogenophaga electricum TaxID=1230953 RepID=A0ABQ6C1K4_9BURK|nr:hypothetical protein [Hydrogenophaga electricum]GLS13594.1 hypothetical protein GCM10007935_10240 [Hydrogenophaga electricum]
MPPPLDLRGRRFGKLLVVDKAPDVLSASGKTSYRAWLVQCDCGRQEVVMAQRLPHCASNRARKDVIEACSHCRAQRTCEVCGRWFESALFRATCSDACALLQKRANNMAYHHRKVAVDPEHYKRIHAERAARAAADTEFALRLRAQQSEQGKRKRERLKADPHRYARTLERARERYAADPFAQAKKRAARDARMAAMTPEQYAAWSERARESWRRSANKVRSTPEGRQRYRDYMREYMRQQALRGLVAAGDELIKRSLNDE